MRGSKPLSDYEANLIIENLKNVRDKCLFIVGLKTGFRISELLSLTVGDCIQYGKIRDSITVKRSNMKGKHSSRTIVLHRDAKQAIETYLNSINVNDKTITLFPFGRIQAHRIIKDAVEKAKIEGKVSTHSMRKSFAKKIYHALNKDLIATKEAMGHESMNSTVSYLSFEREEINKAITET